MYIGERKGKKGIEHSSRGGHIYLGVSSDRTSPTKPSLIDQIASNFRQTERADVGERNSMTLPTSVQ